MLLALASLALAADTDLDGVDNIDDFCPWEDDTVDVDQDGQPDCAQTMLWEFGMSDATNTALAYTGRAITSEQLARYTYDPDGDLYGYPYSGAIVLENFYSNAALQVEQCVELTPGQTYVVGGTFGVEGQDEPVGVVLGVLLHSSPDCASWSRYQAQGWFRMTTWNEWSYTAGTPVTDRYHAFVAPTNAPYALVRVHVNVLDNAIGLAANTSHGVRAFVDNLGLWDTDTIVVKRDDMPDPGTVGRTRAPDVDTPADDRANDGSDRANDGDTDTTDRGNSSGR